MKNFNRKKRKFKKNQVEYLGYLEVVIVIILRKIDKSLDSIKCLLDMLFIDIFLIFNYVYLCSSKLNIKIWLFDIKNILDDKIKLINRRL